MKKLLTLFTVICILFTLTSCDVIAEITDKLNIHFIDLDVDDILGDNTDQPEDEKPEDEKPEDEKPEDEKPEDEKPEDEKPEDNDPGDQSHIYNAFTNEEAKSFEDLFGFVIPFLPNDEYYVEEYTDDYSDFTEIGINFYTFGNTEEEFDGYISDFGGYSFDGTEVDVEGDTWYYYSVGDVMIDVCYYLFDEEYIVDVYVYYYDEDGESEDTGSHLYGSFTNEEAKSFEDLFGFVIPFLPNDEYYVDEYTDDYSDFTEIGINFYAYGNTAEEFDGYLSAFDGYAFDYSEVDSYGDTWYYYSVGDVMIDVCYYETYDGYVTDVYVYFYDYGEGSDIGGKPEDEPEDNDNIITNEGSGLPSAEDGVFDVDFTDAEHVRDVTDQGYYLDGCPTIGSPGVLVIPVEFIDVTAASKGYTTDALVNAFSMGGETDYYSVYDYYYVSSYGQLELDVTVLDFWFRPQYDSSYYYNATYDYYGDEIYIGDQLVLDEALAYLEGIMDLSDFDSDGNGIIDSVVLINTLDVGDEDFFWAYRYWNVYTDEYGYYYEYDGVSANDYMWASYQFLHEGYDEYGELCYDNTDNMSTYTYIHEFGHILGLDDYYDTEGEYDPMEGQDIMDAMLGDHNPFSKFNLGWITDSRLVVTESSVTLTLEDFSKNGDTIIIGNNFDPSLGAYQEYFVLMYYKNTGLNSGDGGYFARDGVLVYHVNASLYSEWVDDEIYYDIYNNNSSPSGMFGTEDNLIEFVKSSSDTFTYVVGDTLPTFVDDNGDELGFTFLVTSLSEDRATITFSAS